MAEHRKTRQEQVQTSTPALTYDLVRFLKLPPLMYRATAIDSMRQLYPARCSVSSIINAIHFRSFGFSPVLVYSLAPWAGGS